MLFQGVSHGVVSHGRISHGVIFNGMVSHGVVVLMVWFPRGLVISWYHHVFFPSRCGLITWFPHSLTSSCPHGTVSAASSSSSS